MQRPAPTSYTGATEVGTLPGMVQLQRSANAVRAECVVCGSHAYHVPGVPGSGRCGNCGSLDLCALPTTAA